MYRIGLGFDVHKTSENRKLFIGGIKIPSKFGLLGHSDADVLIHSICDAILGALALGDIGEHFSDKDPKNKNKKSSFFLKKIIKILKDKNFEIVNIDSTIICEKPKMLKYKRKIKQSLASIMKINIDNISVKATTFEKLGPIGNNEGIACKTIVLLEKMNNDL
ncbi:2-C-methyl-D-erythritol 2,4-cyclodiphosphate synthase [bacterium]|jgi:2-C-methyl-D-erythritol 2,4-cyclodiphosphate synthase|nr:2-C-methyl-D-erythritol 2,4-cyclodiphosphate synthase [bacterium]MBT3795143.1 2-C-methyl-D-erythritol 2,4-cyclodiphosphate synthase [bacterium]MBT4634604.1 2-C-methyl-D-erythritol 2,4-cyclodiphosphate synthase [bacterium]